MAVRTSFTSGEVLAAADLTDTFGAKSNLASPTFTGTPAAPTAASGTNTTQLATTAFVQGAGGLVHINTTTFSAVSSVSLNSVFSATYTWYKIMYYADTSGAAQNLNLRMRNAGTDNTSSNYSTQYLDGSLSTASAARTTGQNLAVLSGVASTGGWGSIDIYNPFSATTTSWSNTTGFAAPVSAIYTGQHSVASSYNGFSLLIGANVFSGTVRVYGYKNS